METSIKNQHSWWNGFAKFSLLMALLFFVTSCVGQGGGSGKRKVSSSGTTTDSNTPSDSNSPDFSSSANYYQNGSSTSTSTFNVPEDFENSFYLRGSGVNAFIADGLTNTVQCLATVHGTSPGNQILIQAATPKFFFNFATNTQEYYYLSTSL